MRVIFLWLALLSVKHAPGRLPHGRSNLRTGSGSMVREPSADPLVLDPLVLDPLVLDPLVLDARCSMPGARCPVLDARCSMPGARCPGRRFARRSVMLSTWRTVSGCNRQTSHCARFVKTRRISLCSLSAIREPLQRVSAHGARQACACYRLPRRIRLLFACVSFSIFSSWPVVRVCVSARVYVILDNVHWRKGPIDRFRQRFQ